MSLDLNVKLTKDIKLKDLLANCRQELIRLTDFQEMPYLQASLMEAGIKAVPGEDYILTADDLMLINFRDHSDIVSIVITELELFPPYVMEEEAGIWAGISVQGGNRTKILLAAGIALSLAQMCNTGIEDDRMFWCKRRSSSYEEFFKDLKSNRELFRALPVD